MGSPQYGPVPAIAREFPDTKFLVPDASVRDLPSRAKNIQGTVFRSEQAGYLAGYMAGLMERRRPGRDVVGSVGGEPFPGVTRWIAGFQQGARRAAPGIVTLNAYSHDFTNPTKCRTVALGQIAKGAGAIFNVAGGCGYGALDAAKEKHVWGVGVDLDQSYLGRYVMTSAVNRLDVRIREAIEELARGRFKTGGDTVFDLRNGGVGLAKASPDVPATVLKEVERVRRQIIAGKIKVQGTPNSRP
jgi:basic membrane protein A